MRTLPRSLDVIVPRAVSIMAMESGSYSGFDAFLVIGWRTERLRGALPRAVMLVSGPMAEKAVPFPPSLVQTDSAELYTDFHTVGRR
ncbi:hypothetical protein GCM10011349_05350 [Novosphingobium indicum]|uniref:Uncharacterized protein n=1 Tax=Novosphingobium indicum TaxID=462949 RepID=A0ABQ2J8D9_9SPHN|nr:hypothetical protein GCM10011349_05350 [Novosphingobium indicum]